MREKEKCEILNAHHNLITTSELLSKNFPWELEGGVTTCFSRCQNLEEI